MGSQQGGSIPEDMEKGKKMIELEESIMLDGKMITGMKIEMESSNIPLYLTVPN